MTCKLKDSARRVAGAFTVLLVLVAGCSRTPSPKEAVSAYLSASNSHNVDSLLAWYSDDAVFVFVGAGAPITGREALRGLAEYDSVLSTVLALRIIRAHGDSLLLEGTESDDWLNAAGLPPNRYSSVLFVVRRGRVRIVRAELSDSSAAGINTVMNSLVPWAQERHPKEYLELISGGMFVYNAENAGRILALLKDWQHSQTISRPIK